MISLRKVFTNYIQIVEKILLVFDKRFNEIIIGMVKLDHIKSKNYKNQELWK